jgi:hypothetical protein
MPGLVIGEDGQGKCQSTNTDDAKRGAKSRFCVKLQSHG